MWEFVCGDHIYQLCSSGGLEDYILWLCHFYLMTTDYFCFMVWCQAVESQHWQGSNTQPQCTPAHRYLYSDSFKALACTYAHQQVIGLLKEGFMHMGNSCHPIMQHFSHYFWEFSEGKGTWEKTGKDCWAKCKWPGWLYDSKMEKKGKWLHNGSIIPKRLKSLPLHIPWPRAHHKPFTVKIT